MHTDSPDMSWTWLLREGMIPVLAMAVIIWIASIDLSVTPAWSSEPTFGAGSTPDAPVSSASLTGGDSAVEPPSFSLMLPVANMSASDLVDTFDDARSGGRTHKAIDIMAPSGTPVVATADGVVMKRHTGDLGGKSLYVASLDSSYVFYYAHLSQYASGVTSGTPVSAGDTIGFVGTTGNANTPHLHFAIWAVDGRLQSSSRHPINPYPLLAP
ncbi:metalloendopeptidase [Longibacter salinarum]|uniref:Metalloendopeptidase n=1 Tax=Longibacter salinarum TaxID=1850348 RepID=A0A2A8CTN5_9BACT|nr:M23 family metallopeptidase [Longibacter salinarum]PEN11065.1 metalloendopeptidase [Longibacter salinarum]